MKSDGQGLVIIAGIHRARDTAFGARQWRWASLSKKVVYRLSRKYEVCRYGRFCSSDRSSYLNVAGCGTGWKQTMRTNQNCASSIGDLTDHKPCSTFLMAIITIQEITNMRWFRVQLYRVPLLYVGFPWRFRRYCRTDESIIIFWVPEIWQDGLSKLLLRAATPPVLFYYSSLMDRKTSNSVMLICEAAIK